MKELLDNSEVNEVMEILENMQDEELAVSLLKEFNEKTKALGELLVNRDKNLQHGEWKAQSDDAKKSLDELISRIKSFN